MVESWSCGGGARYTRTSGEVDVQTALVFLDEGKLAGDDRLFRALLLAIILRIVEGSEH